MRALRPGCSAGCAAFFELVATSQQGRQITLHVEEIDRAMTGVPLLGQRRTAGDAASRLLSTIRQLAPEAHRVLEQPQAPLLALDVVAPGRDQAAPQLVRITDRRVGNRVVPGGSPRGRARAAAATWARRNCRSRLCHPRAASTDLACAGERRVSGSAAGASSAG